MTQRIYAVIIGEEVVFYPSTGKLKEAFGTMSTYEDIDGDVIEIRHPVNTKHVFRAFAYDVKEA